MKKILAFASHVALIKGKPVDGIGHSLIDTLAPITDEFLYVRHSMDGLLPAEVQIFRKGKATQKSNLHVLRRIAPIRYISEFINTVYYFSFVKKVDIYVGIDPLNAVAGVVLKKLGRVEKAIFYTADYSLKRFDNPQLNKIYHSIDAYCVKNADEVWSVSSKIVAIRKKMGLADKKNIFLPNVPPVEHNRFRKNKHDRYKLITYGMVDVQLDFKGAIDAVAALKDEFPKLSFTIIGNGPKEAEVKAYIKKRGVTDRVEMKGRLPLEQTLEHNSKAGIGLALYTGAWSFNQFGDSTKSREYFHYGVPVISTDTHSTVDEIKKTGSGIIVAQDVDEYIAAIRKIIANYDSYTAASIALGEKYEGAHKRELLRLIDKKP